MTNFSKKETYQSQIIEILLKLINILTIFVAVTTGKCLYKAMRQSIQLEIIDALDLWNLWPAYYLHAIIFDNNNYNLNLLFQYLINSHFNNTMIMGSQAVLFITLFVSFVLAIDWKPVDLNIADKISQGYFTGCALGVYSANSTLYKKAYGTLFHKHDLYAPPVTPQTFFDLGFITQVIGTNSGLMQLYDLKKLHVTDRVEKHLSQFGNNGKQNLTIQNLLLHNSGLQSTLLEPLVVPTELIKKINTLKLEYKEQTKFEYSELGYVVLGQVIQKINKKGLNQSLEQILILSGLKQTYFKPTNVPVYNIAPCGYHAETTRGLPANKISFALGGIAGNAGLFSIVDNLGQYMQLLLNKGKMPRQFRVFTQEVVNLFTTRVEQKKYQNTRALGWDTIPQIDPPCGKHFSKNSFGLSDPSGSYLWADKDKNISIILLVAGGYPTYNNLNRGKAQGEISDEIMSVLGF